MAKALGAQKQAPSRNTSINHSALKRAQADIRADMEQEAKVLIKKSGYTTQHSHRTTVTRALPFVHRPARGFKGSSNWHVSPADSYGQACSIGATYAAHFAQYLKDNPGRAESNFLGQIAADIDFKDDRAAIKGYWVGFFSYLERLILAQANKTDLFADVDRRNEFCKNVDALRDLAPTLHSAAQ